MGYESGQFPNSGATNNTYGAVTTENGIMGGGDIPGDGQIKESVVYAKAADFTIDDATNASFVTKFSLPTGAVPINAIFEVSTAFTQTGGTTSTTLNVGTSGSEGTNGFTITDAATSLSAVTEVDAVGEGTWLGSTPVSTSADTAVGVQLTMGGGTITSIDGGVAKITIRYWAV